MRKAKLTREEANTAYFTSDNIFSISVKHELPITDSLFLLRTDVIKYNNKIFDYTESLEQRIKELEHQIGSFENVAKRVLTELNNHWNLFTDDEGYGPESLERDLKKVADGNYKDYFMESSSKVISELENKVKKLEAERGEVVKE